MIDDIMRWERDEVNITKLYEIIDNAKPEYALVVWPAADPIGPNKYIHITFKLYIPKFAYKIIEFKQNT